MKDDQLRQNKLYPNVGTYVYFHSASLIARNIKKIERPVKGSSAHRTQIAKIEDGYLIIDKSWFTTHH